MLLALLELVTVGLPFCAFKILTGVIAVQWSPAGYALIALGIIDLVLNTVNLIALVALRRRIGSVCLVELVLRRFARRAEVGLAIDVFVSFALVALVVGLGWIALIPAAVLPLWNLAVVLNVLGAGVGRLFSALSADPRPA